MPFADSTAVTPPAHVLFAPKAVTWRSVTVRPGDTVWDLAIAHHTTPEALVARNRLPLGGSLVRPGQTLLVPVPGPAASTAPRPTKATAATAKPMKKPAPGRTSTPRPRAGGGRIHVVVEGDTMFGIAARYHVSLTKLLAANRLPNPARIDVGARIVIPVAVAATPKPTPSTRPQPTSENSFAGYTYSDATVAAARASRARLARADVPSRTQIAAMIRATATRHGVDPHLALALGWQESGWNQRAVSVANAIGTMQVMPVSGTWASQLAGRTLDLYDAQDNITAGVVLLRALQSAADSREQAVAGYYQGLHSVRTRGMFEDTKRYVATVLAFSERM
ncbi:peptidoglycan-binding LysM [Intrasporangium oryzae NRRL B-24470]|uniref:Peptidoglycan-binding LysM n=1 Tax=Intrasporangium oryzae NRRL B-24470 TaxID=1386089 RepID=W9G1K3_9MICO|nr:LysM peptidoglycan-binding domain-containing protein [Intrasporangium oryzae]EWS99970.1 peptidoglycan-binding LysM [Intrasporangium oryzae NRRL B-24470]